MASKGISPSGKMMAQQAAEENSRIRERRDDGQVAEIVGARHGDPFSFLGMHSEDGGIVVRSHHAEDALAAICRIRHGCQDRGERTVRKASLRNVRCFRSALAE